jgi:hypothetical protein
MMRCQDIMVSVKSASLATATDHSLYFKFIKVTTSTCTVPACTYPHRICK